MAGAAAATPPSDSKCMFSGCSLGSPGFRAAVRRQLRRAAAFTLRAAERCACVCVCVSSEVRWAAQCETSSGVHQATKLLVKSEHNTQTPLVSDAVGVVQHAAESYAFLYEFALRLFQVNECSAQCCM